MNKILFIFLGGGVGALLRYFISGYIQSLSNTIFPVGTLGVNLIGCFIIGVLFSLFEEVILSTDIKNMILIGIIGAFTTFSTYSLECINLIRDGEIKMGLLNIVLSNVGGIVLVFAGVLLARTLLNAMR